MRNGSSDYLEIQIINIVILIAFTTIAVAAAEAPAIPA